MSYLLLVIEKPGDRAARTETQARALYESMQRFSEDLKRRGALVMAQSLKSETTAVRVAHEEGRLVVRDGPFAEAKELVGGFFLLTCETLEEATRIARECPAMHWATLEVRELGPCFS
jgi:hypothetical protein